MDVQGQPYFLISTILHKNRIQAKINGLKGLCGFLLGLMIRDS